MENPRVRVYTDYKSPYAFVANAALFDLEKSEGVELEWLPYTLRIAEFMGAVEERTPLPRGTPELFVGDEQVDLVHAELAC